MNTQQTLQADKLPQTLEDLMYPDRQSPPINLTLKQLTKKWLADNECTEPVYDNLYDVCVRIYDTCGEGTFDLSNWILESQHLQLDFRFSADFFLAWTAFLIRENRLREIPASQSAYEHPSYVFV